MKRIQQLLLTCFCFASLNVFADISGTWAGVLIPAPGTELNIHFVIEEKADDSYTIVLTSPDSGAIKDVVASNVKYTDSLLSFEVPDLSGSYSGKFVGDKFEGNWMQLDESIPLTLTPFEQKILAPEIIAKISGRWQGELEVPGQKLSIVMNFKTNSDGKLIGFMESPDQGSTKFPIENIKTDGSKLSMDVANIGGSYKATITDETMQGDWTQGRAFPLSMEKKEEDKNAYVLELDKSARELLRGNWFGQINTPIGEVAAVFRFEEERPEFIRGYFDSPDRGATGIPIKSVSVQDNKVEFKVANNSEFSGTLNGKKITGKFTQPGQQMDLSIENGELPPQLLGLPQPKNSTLIGTWQGEISTPRGKLTLLFRFEKNGNDTVGFIDSPDQGMNGARIKSASFIDNQLTLKSDLLRMEFNGKLANDSIVGKAKQGGQETEVTLSKKI